MGTLSPIPTGDGNYVVATAALGQTDRSVATNLCATAPPTNTKHSLTIILIHTACFIQVGGNRSARRKPTRPRGEHANSHRSYWESNPAPSETGNRTQYLLNHSATVPPTILS